MNGEYQKYKAQISKLETEPFEGYLGQEGFQLIVFTPPKHKFIKLELNAWGDGTFKFSNKHERRFRWLYNPKERVQHGVYPFTTHLFNLAVNTYSQTMRKITQSLSSIRTEPLEKLRLISAECSFPLIPSTIIFDYAQDYYLHPNEGTKYWTFYPESISPEYLDISILPIVTYRFEKPLKVLEGISAVTQFVTDVFKVIMEYDLPEPIKENIIINPRTNTAQYGGL